MTLGAVAWTLSCSKRDVDNWNWVGMSWNYNLNSGEVKDSLVSAVGVVGTDRLDLIPRLALILSCISISQI